MAIVTLTPTEMKRAGVLPGLAAANVDGYAIPNNGKVWLHVKNSHTSSWVVTITSAARPISGLALTDVTVTVVNGGVEQLIGPFPPDIFNDAAGRINVTFSGITALTFAAFRLP